MKLDELLKIDQNDAATKKKNLTTILVCAGAALVLLVVVALLLVGVNNLRESNEQLQEELKEAQKIDVTYVGNKLETISELATAKMTYNGIVHFEDGNIPFINKKEFYMSYRVSLKAGFDLSKADIRVADNSVTINLPEAEIYDPVVDEESFQFFDESIALFNKESKQDLVEAISAAKEDVLKQPETEALKETAKEQVTILLTALFEGQIGDRELVINIG